MKEHIDTETDAGLTGKFILKFPPSLWSLTNVTDFNVTDSVIEILA